MVSEKVQRGKTDLVISCDSNSSGKHNFNTSAIKNYVKELKGIADDMNLKSERFLQLVLSLPDSIKEKKSAVTATEWRQVSRLVHDAINDFNKFRKRRNLSVLEISSFDNMFDEWGEKVAMDYKNIVVRDRKFLKLDYA